MKVKATWLITLPLKFKIGNDFKKTILTKLSFEIESYTIELLKSIMEEDNTIDRLKVVSNEDYDVKYLPSYQNHEYLSQFDDRITIKLGKVIQSWLDGFSKHTNDEYHQIFDGERFTTPFKLEVCGNILSACGNRIDNKRSYYLDDETLDNAINFACKEKNTFDYSWYLIRDSEHFLDMGKYEISIINMAITIEFLVSSALSEFINSNGYYKKEYMSNLKELYGEYPSFVEKYLLFGLPLITDKKMSDEILNCVDFIYKVRNDLAHGKQFFKIKLIIENNINEYNIRNFWHHLINIVTEIHNFFYDLNNQKV